MQRGAKCEESTESTCCAGVLFGSFSFFFFLEMAFFFLRAASFLAGAFFAAAAAIVGAGSAIRSLLSSVTLICHNTHDRFWQTGSKKETKKIT